MENKDLINLAIEAKKNAHVPYSHFKVGAALLTKSGKIYTGHNIENFGIQSTCSERTVFTKALSEGEKEFVAILVIAYPKAEQKFTSAWPCGYCREFMSSFLGSEFLIYTIDDNENFIEEKLGNLVPLKDLSKNLNYKLDENINLQNNVSLGKNIEELKKQTNQSELKILLEEAKKASKNTNLYFQKEGAALLVSNEQCQTKLFTGASQTDNNGSIIRAPKVALLKALSEGFYKFDKILILKYENEKIEELWMSYDVIQLFLQYTSLDFKILTIDNELNVKETTIKEVLPYPFEFEK